MNTSQYGDFVYDTFSREEVSKTVREMQFTFIKETRLGEELDIFRGADTDGTLYFRVLEAETKKPRFEAMIRFAPDGAAGEGTP
jgi:acyl-ACP thioesterase